MIILFHMNRSLLANIKVPSGVTKIVYSNCCSITTIIISKNDTEIVMLFQIVNYFYALQFQIILFLQKRCKVH